MDTLLSIVIAILGGLVGGSVTHFFASRRDVRTKRREIILANLMDALEDLDQSNSIRRGADAKRLEKVVYRINLVGDPPLVAMVNRVADDFAKTGTADTTQLLVALRDNVRQELALAKLPPRFHFLTVSSAHPKEGGEPTAP